MRFCSVQVCSQRTRRSLQSIRGRSFTHTTPTRRAMLCPVIWCSENGAMLVAQSAIPITQAEFEHLCDTDGFPDWDYFRQRTVTMNSGLIPSNITSRRTGEGHKTENSRALDYSTPALDTPEEREALFARLRNRHERRILHRSRR